MNIDKRVAALAQLRAMKAELTSSYDDKIRTVDQAIAETENQIRSELNRAGLTQARTSAGLVSLKQERKYHVADWPTLYEHIKETGNFSLLQKRLGEGATKEYIDEHTNVPPGVTFTDLISVHFTKPRD